MWSRAFLLRPLVPRLLWKTFYWRLYSSGSCMKHTKKTECLFITLNYLCRFLKTELIEGIYLPLVGDVDKDRKPRPQALTSLSLVVIFRGDSGSESAPVWKGRFYSLLNVCNRKQRDIEKRLTAGSVCVRTKAAPNALNRSLETRSHLSSDLWLWRLEDWVMHTQTQTVGWLHMHKMKKKNTHTSANIGKTSCVNLCRSWKAVWQ